MSQVPRIFRLAVSSGRRNNTLSWTEGRSGYRWTEDMFEVFNAVKKEELWDRWQRGESLKVIGRAI